MEYISLIPWDVKVKILCDFYNDGDTRKSIMDANSDVSDRLFRRFIIDQAVDSETLIRELVEHEGRQ